MSAPALPLPTPGLFPDWYKGGFVDIERLLIAFFGGMLPTIRTLTWLPPEKEQLFQSIANGVIYLRIFRLGGAITSQEDGKADVDNPTVQFAALSSSRDLSWEVIEFVRQVMYCYRNGGGRIVADDLYAHVTLRREVSGPSLTPESFRDQRLVPATFELEVQRRKGLPSFSAYSRELIAS